MNEIERLNNQIQDQNEMYRNYYELQLEVKKMNDGLNKCIEIVNDSIGNSAVNNRLETLRIENENLNKKSENTIYNELNKIKKNISRINGELDKLKKDKEE